MVNRGLIRPYFGGGGGGTIGWLDIIRFKISLTAFKGHKDGH